MIKKLINRWKMEWEVYFLVDSVKFMNSSEEEQDRLIQQVRNKYKGKN
jgi:hypothetical protein